MHAAILSLMAFAAICIGPVRPGDAADVVPNSDCLSISLAQEMISKDIETTHGQMFVLRGGLAKRYLDAISSDAPSDGYAEVLIYKRDDVTNVGLITPDMASACPFRAIPTVLHLKALIRANITLP